LLFWAVFGRGLRYRDLLLFSVLSDYEFAIQIDAAYLKGRAMSLQYVLIPAVRVYEDATGAMEDSSIIDQWISAHSAIHLLTSYAIGHAEPCLSKGKDSSIGTPASPRQRAKHIADYTLISSLGIKLPIIACR
jgi:hypothetical protein